MAFFSGEDWKAGDFGFAPVGEAPPRSLLSENSLEAGKSRPERGGERVGSMRAFLEVADERGAGLFFAVGGLVVGGFAVGGFAVGGLAAFWAV